MEKLKQSIVKAHEDIEEEKQKNIEILNLIFPSEIAKKLWRGEQVKACSVENVTLLYSDIVGFTSICSTAQPIEIITMLKTLYTDFDHYCGLLDVYKIETIGDAYLLAGNLHKTSETHAQQIAWMGLIMIELSARNMTPKGDRIKMRVGLHTGEVLAGIVGIKQPRYCLFGNNCTVANKFESMSVEQRIHVSPVTKRFMEKMDGFEFEARSKEHLPENWFSASYAQPDDISWFMNTYKHKGVKQKAGGEYDCFEHVHAALKHYKIIEPDTEFKL
jgi:guanylate cyclase soluble subunit alpha